MQGISVNVQYIQEFHNLDSIFKSRDITLPTKVRLVKAMVFPVVMYGCESWTVASATGRSGKSQIITVLMGNLFFNISEYRSITWSCWSFVHEIDR